MNTLIIADSQETIDFLHSKVEFEASGLSAATSLASQFDFIYTTQRVTNQPTIVETVGSLVGVGQQEVSAPEILVRMLTGYARLPLNAFYVMNNVILAVGEDLENWIYITPNGYSSRLLPRLKASFDRDKEDNNASFRPFIELGRIMHFTSDSVNATTRSARRILAYRNGVKTVRTASDFEGMNKAFAELGAMLCQLDRLDNDVYTARLYGGVGFGSNNAIVEVWLDDALYGEPCERNESCYNQSEIEIFGTGAMRSIPSLIRGIGGDPTNHYTKSFDAYGGCPKIYINYQGVTISVQYSR